MTSGLRTETFFQVGATFVSPDDEHYYGLGQNQEGFLDHRGHTVECWHNYTATGGPSVCVPFHGHQLRLWTDLGQSLEDNHRAGFQRADPLDFRGGRSRFVLRDRGREHR